MGSIELSMFPVLGKRFAVTTTLETLTILVANIEVAQKQTESIDMPKQYQWLYGHLLNCDVKDITTWETKIRDLFLNDCLLLQALRLVLKNIPLPVQLSGLHPDITNTLESKGLLRLVGEK